VYRTWNSCTWGFARTIAATHELWGFCGNAHRPKSEGWDEAQALAGLATTGCIAVGKDASNTYAR
jgi:hypothetical protein